MNIFIAESIRELGLVVLLLFPALIGLRVIKVVSKTVFSLYPFVLLITLFNLPPIIIAPLLSLWLFLFACDKIFLIKFRTYLLLDPDKNNTAIEEMLRHDNENRTNITFNNGYVTFDNINAKSIKGELMLLLIKADMKRVKRSYIDRALSIILFSSAFIIFLFRFIRGIIK